MSCISNSWSQFYSYPKMLLLFFSLILTAWTWFKIIFLDSSFSFCLLLPDLDSCKIGILSSTFPSLQILFFHFWFTMNVSQYQRDTIICLYAWLRTYAYIAFCPCVFYPQPYILNVQTSSSESADIFSIAVHVFRNLFWKNVLYLRKF